MISMNPRQGPTGTRHRLLTWPIVLFLLAAVAATTSFYVLLTVVPTYAAASAGSSTAAGLATGALMLTTVAAELASPRLIARFGRPVMLAAGLLLLGVPAMLLIGQPGLPVVVGVCALRGLGFGVAVVLGSSWMAVLVPAQRRGEGLGLYGVTVGVPAIVALPLSVWFSDNFGYLPVFIAGGAVAVLGLIPLVLLRATGATASAMDAGGGRLGVLDGLGTPALVRPALPFAATAAAAGIVVTFLPSAVTGSAIAVVAPALFAQAATSAVGRSWAGRYGDRVGAGRVLVASVLVAAAGLLALALTGQVAAIVAGAAVFGLGFGAAQNASITLMFERVAAGGYDTASAVWNIGYDAGMGLGAAGFGLLAVHRVPGRLRDRRRADPDLIDHRCQPNGAVTMGTVVTYMAVSLDGFATGPDGDLSRLHHWMASPASAPASAGFFEAGATIMGRRTWDSGQEPWGDDEVFPMPVYVLTHERRDPFVGAARATRSSATPDGPWRWPSRPRANGGST